ncbi:troponin c [Plakobranchus ocellatus]|uniref:Troponin c n=1 Tax=Plakobranchus ocellatus TaxID=259542 RepID=A0AAV4DCL8_9GAST|nr:troponin c [Plakobranchus ocellatus]
MSGDEDNFQVSEKVINDASQTFSLFDKKGDGHVSTKDLGILFKSLGLQCDGQKLKDWADEADEEACGHITLEQFKAIFKKKLKEDEDERELKEAFRVLDKANKGVIAVDDLKWILKSLGDDLTDDEIDEMIDETDTDQSGTVDYEEFRTLMCS